MNFFKHKTSIIDKGAEIGNQSSVWHFSHICSGAKIGSNVTIGQNVFVGNNVVVGDNCKIQNNVSIFDGVELEEGVFCGPSMVFTNVYNPRALINRKNEFKKTKVRRGASFGANSTVICGVEIGEFSFVGAGTLIRTKVPSFALMVGVPARQIGWVSEFGEKLDLPLNGSKEATCNNTGEKYIINGSEVYKAKASI